MHCAAVLAVLQSKNDCRFMPCPLKNKSNRRYKFELPGAMAASAMAYFSFGGTEQLSRNAHTL